METSEQLSRLTIDDDEPIVIQLPNIESPPHAEFRNLVGIITNSQGFKDISSESLALLNASLVNFIAQQQEHCFWKNIKDVVPHVLRSAVADANLQSLLTLALVNKHCYSLVRRRLLARYKEPLKLELEVIEAKKLDERTMDDQIRIRWILNEGRIPLSRPEITFVLKNVDRQCNNQSICSFSFKVGNFAQSRNLITVQALPMKCGNVAWNSCVHLCTDCVSIYQDVLADVSFYNFRAKLSNRLVFWKASASGSTCHLKKGCSGANQLTYAVASFNNPLRTQGFNYCGKCSSIAYSFSH